MPNIILCKSEQRNYYGINACFPASILHAREIPGSGGKVIATESGHHDFQDGYIIIMDSRAGEPRDGVDEGRCVGFVPRDVNGSVRCSDAGVGKGYIYPYPLDETAFLVSHKPWGHMYTHYSLYFMTVSGDRELLVDGTGAAMEGTSLFRQCGMEE
ncbi:MAG: hypothetical protein GF350_13105 [Chitinivibrionales bacterium]|nr:hypothetical protein [Chitinivibrionales bacterium]